MPVKYYKQEVADLRGEGRTSSYYRIKLKGAASWEDLVGHIARNYNYIDEGDVIKVMQMTVKCMAEIMAEGYSVSIDGLGRFTPVIGMKEGMERDESAEGAARPNARSFEVNRVRFHADQNLVKRVAAKCQLERGGETPLCVSKYTREERLALAVGYLETHPYMRVSDYAEMTGLSKTTASQELKSFAHEPELGIASEGKRASLLYVKKTAE